MVWRAALPAIVIQIAVACDGGRATRAHTLPKCDGSVDSMVVGVGVRVTPTFGWEPECRMAATVVVRTSDFEQMWFVDSDWALAPGLRYGEVPRGATVLVAAKPLMAGVEYEVALLPPAAGADLLPILGSKRFTPSLLDFPTGDQRRPAP